MAVVWIMVVLGAILLGLLYRGLGAYLRDRARFAQRRPPGGS